MASTVTRTATAKKDPVLVVVQLSGGNDFMNTLIPFTEGIYYDARPLVACPSENVLPFNGHARVPPLGGAR